MPRKTVALSLFWRTFFLLLLLLVGVLAAWVYTLGLVDGESGTRPNAEQLVTSARLMREALHLLPPADRPAAARAVAQHGNLKLMPRTAADGWSAPPADRWHGQLAELARTRLGSDTVLAASVNGEPGDWLGITVDREAWWLMTPAAAPRGFGGTGLLWMALALLGTLAASALIARRINQPLRDLSFAASRIRGGEYESRLDETNITSEIREVNKGFNRMARELARVEEDRAVMLAGISHDLRTPLARLRLEAEMSVHDDEARANMADDIDQLDAIIDKFMDYARPGETHLKPVLLARLVDKEAAAFRDPSEIQISSKVAVDIKVQADEVELGRVFANLFENARRYGRNSDSGVAIVQVSYVRTGPWVICTVRDTGSGVQPEKLGQLTTPFFRGDAARTAATGAGLGLAIVEKAMQRMGGQVEIANAPDGGLMVHLRLKHAKA